MLAGALYAQGDMKMQNMEMGGMPFGGDQMMYNNGFENNGFANNGQRMTTTKNYADNDQRMHDNSRYQNRAMPTSGKGKNISHDRAGFIDQ
jgi:hypothetical protein